MPTQDNTVIPNILLGCDPEYFLRDKVTKKIVSGHDFIPGTKEKPYPVDHGALQADGVAAEINIVPSSTRQDFSTRIRYVQESLLRVLNGKYDLVTEPVAFFDKEYFESLPLNTRQLGCNPDFNAWTGEVNNPPDDPDTFPRMRTAAGHIHVGWTNGRGKDDHMHFEDCRVVMKQMDYYIGMFSILWDPDCRRRDLYGKAGAFRNKSYGAEYRTPSNMWTKEGALREWIFSSSYKAVANVFKGRILEDEFGDFAQKVIDTNDLNWTQTEDGRRCFRYMDIPWPPVDDKLLFPWKYEGGELKLPTIPVKKLKHPTIEELIGDIDMLNHKNKARHTYATVEESIPEANNF